MAESKKAKEKADADAQSYLMNLTTSSKSSIVGKTPKRTPKNTSMLSMKKSSKIEIKIERKPTPPDDILGGYYGKINEIKPSQSLIYD